MMIETQAPTRDIATKIRAAFADRRSAHPDDPLGSLREDAIRAFDRQGIPSKKTEAWKYTPVAKTLREDFALIDAPSSNGVALRGDDFRLPGLDADLLVVVNGKYRADLSDLSGLSKGVEIASLGAMTFDDDAEARDHVGQMVDLDEDPFIALNTALFDDVLVIRVPRGVTLQRPLQIAHVALTDRPRMIHPRSSYFFGENSEAVVIETYHDRGGAAIFTNSVSEIQVDRAARINLVKMQAESANAHRVDSTQVVQTGESHFAAHTYTLGGGLVRNNMMARPSAPNCETHLYGLYILAGDQHVDNHTLIDHASAGCYSNELYRGIVDERSTGVFNGKVFVRRDSQQTNAYQSSQGVVLSEDAHHYSKPELEIYADDVKCSHGSTTGELEPEHVFYLRSRGLDEVTAKSLLLYAFARDIVDQLPNEAVRGYLDNLIEERLVLSAQRR